MTTPHNDPLARWCVYGLVALALWAGVRQLERNPDAANATPYTVIAATATPSLPTVAPALADVAPAPAQTAQEAAGAPEAPIAVQSDAAQAVTLPAPVWTPEELASVPAPAETIAPEEAAPDPALQYGTAEFNHALAEAHEDLPVLECPCGIDTTPQQPTAKDYAYSKARTR